MKHSILPLGFNSTTTPNKNSRCNHMSCTVNNLNEHWQLFQGYWHSYHKACLNGSPSCQLCEKLLTGKIQELGQVAKEVILHLKPTNEADQDRDNGPETAECIDPAEINETIVNLSNLLSLLQSPPQPSLQHISHPEAPHVPFLSATNKTVLHYLRKRQTLAQTSHNSVSQAEQRKINTASTLKPDRNSH